MTLAPSGAVVLALSAALAAQPDQPPQIAFPPFDRAAFAGHAEALGADADLLAAFATRIEEEGVGAASEWLLRRLVPPFDAAVRLAEDGDPRAALELGSLSVGGEDADPWVVAFARYHLGRVFLDADDPEGAVEVFSDYLRAPRVGRTPLDSEVVFFYGNALAQVPDRNAAKVALQQFVELFPEAPERYRAAAAQLLAEMDAPQNPLHDVADRMKGIERRIRKTETGEETQKRQEEVVATLQEILEMIEQQEQQAGGGGGGNPTSPRASSNLSPGATRVGNLQRVSGSTDRWGQMKDRDRREITAEVETRLTGRYKKLTEDYYRRINRGGQ